MEGFLLTDILNFPPDQFKIFLLVLIRVSVVMFLFPVFDSRVFPTLAKVGLALVVSMAFFPNVAIDPGVFPDTIVETFVLIVSEMIVGMILGLTVRLFFAAIQLACQLVSFQMGFSMINVIDPQTGGQVSILDQIGYWIVLLLFLFLNGHHFFITALMKSFQIIGIGSIAMNKGMLIKIISLSSDMFALAIKIGAPGILALLFVSSAFGLCAKFAPQMNILIAAFPVKILVGFIFFGLMLTLFLISTRVFIQGFYPLIVAIMVYLGGGP